MTATAGGDDFAGIRARFLPIFERIAEGSVERERERILPFEQVKWLAEAGFGALRVPRSSGGAGLSLLQFFQLLVDLAAADANLPQILRGHIAFVEDRLHAADRESAERWFGRFVAGALVGNAWSETGAVALGAQSTVLSRDGDGWRLDGAKFYTTGSLFADWTDVTATRDDGTAVAVLVQTTAPGVTVRDDWDGFGQRLTGTGGIDLSGVAVSDGDVQLFTDRFTYQTAIYQLVLLGVLAGVARATRDDATAELRARNRVYSHGNADAARDDAQLLAVVGEISSIAFVSEATVERIAAMLDAVAALESTRGSDSHQRVRAEAEIAAAEGQIVLTELVQRSASMLFDALGSSAVSRTKDLDRHWRNARTVSSHNPVVYKARIVGDWRVNAVPPPYVWSIGTTASSAPRS
jgi:alkylation response protein AidB-like acyl-CoA dehydrogenase